MKKLIIGALAAISLAGTASAQGQTLEGVDAGTYKLDKTHAYLTFSVSHGGLSDYVVNLTGYDATLEFDPADPTNSSIMMSIDPTQINTYYPNPEKKVEWEDELVNDPKFLNAGAFPNITFKSTSVTKTGAFDGKVTGDLTFLGMTKPVTMNVTYNGLANLPWMGETDLIGFDAVGTFDRSNFGMTHLIKNGIGDNVTIKFSGEFVHTGK